MFDLINLSFLTGTFPDKLKIAQVKPLYKSGKISAPINYRQFQSYHLFLRFLKK